VAVLESASMESSAVAVEARTLCAPKLGRHIGGRMSRRTHN
jgi:hypothetical protein